MGLSWPPKDPDEVLDYEIDWSNRLDGDTILTSEFMLDIAAGLAIESQLNTSSTTTVWLSEGTQGNIGKVRCRIMTANGRVMEETVSIRIKAR